MVGQIVKVISGFYDINSYGEIFRVRGSGNLRAKNNSPVVGDIVEFTPNKFITSIHERKNVFIRPRVSNVDQVVVVTSLKEPNYSPFLLNKMLALIEFKYIHPVLVFTKKDLIQDVVSQEYIDMGYEVYVVNNHNPKDVEKMNHIFKDKLTVFTGQTGAGKSSTISNLSKVILETQEISKSLGRGKHTTRVVEIIPWYGGQLIDTPGFSSFEIGLKPIELATSFEIFRKFKSGCQFKDCLHHKEKKCGIKVAVANGNISDDRYQNYLRMLKEAQNE